MPKLHLFLLIVVLVLIAHGSVTDEVAPPWSYAIAGAIVCGGIVATVVENKRLKAVANGKPKPPFWKTLIETILNIK